MPRYFFNVHGETCASPDLIGRKLPDDEAARAKAKSVANDVAKAELSSALLPGNPWVEVVDYDQRSVAVIPATETVAGPNRTELMLEGFPAVTGPDDSYLEKRVREEMEAAVHCGDAKAAAAHVELANRYLIKLNCSSRASGPV